MIIHLDKIQFINDFFSVMLSDGSYLVINKVDESMRVQETDSDVEIKNLTIFVVDAEGNSTQCPCVIGLGNDLMLIATEYTEYEGKVLTPDNMAYCTIEVYGN